MLAKIKMVMDLPMALIVKGRLGQQVLLERLVRKGKQDLRVPLVLRVHKGKQAPRVLQGRLVRKAKQDQRAQRAQQGLLAQLVRLVGI